MGKKRTKATLEQQESTWDVATSTGQRREWQRSDVHVVLVNPQIPQNAGNVARTCAATNIALHLVKPLGFEINNKKLKRAGLDYWDQVAVAIHESWEDFETYIKALPGNNKLYGYSKLARVHYATPNLYTKDHTSWLLFGSETTGLPAEAHEATAASGGGMLKIPMANYEHVRSLNLSTSAGVGIYEALRQLDGVILPEDMDEGNAE